MGGAVPVKIKFGFCKVRAVVVFAMLFLGVSGCSGSAPAQGVKIVSYQLRDRVITLQQPIMRSSLIVGFRVEPGDIPFDRLTVEGELTRDGTPVGRDRVIILDGPTGSLGFAIPHQTDLADRERPYSIPDGLYSIRIRAKEHDGRVVAELSKEFRRSQLGRTFVAVGHEYTPVRYIPEREETGRHLVRSVSARINTEDFTLFVHSPQERVFSNSMPDNGAGEKVLTVRAARGETLSVALSLRGKKALGGVSLDVSPLRGAAGSILREAFMWGAVRDLTEVVREDTKHTTLEVRRAPRLIEPGAVTVGRDEARSFWLSLAIPVAASSGTYSGSITVRLRSGVPIDLPVRVEVLPFTLQEPDIRYGMMMDYAFYELDNGDWRSEEKRTLRRRGEEVYRDFRDHGMTVAYPHSHFYYRTDDQGRPVLEGLKAALEAYRNQGFPGPFVWYIGHLLHTAKPKHPASILLYDEAVAVRRLKLLLAEFEQLARRSAVPKERLLVQVVDEPDRQDALRTKVGKKLNAIVREMGFRTLITRPWPEVDVICTGDPDDASEAARLRRTAGEWWVYPNGALTGQNLSYTRYVFGFGAWRWGVKGVVPWTYQMSQGSNGNPFTVMDGPEIMVAYPGTGGPISTPAWETIRDGINDYRYIQTLRNLISRAKSRGDKRGISVERQLEQLRISLGIGPTAGEGCYGDWPPERFDSVRGSIISLIGELRL
jgi:hypothetical protein